MSSSHSTSADIQGEGVRARLGLWLFLLSEILLFGGMFLLYAMYRYKYAPDFHAGSQELSRFDGTLNTIVLLTSSLTVVVALHSLHVKHNVRRTAIFLAATIALGLTFLVVKSFEWTAKFEHGLYPGAKFLLSQSHGLILFFGLYFTMTGLHALHVMVGMGVLSGVLNFVLRGKITPDHVTIMENGALYWHLVDIIWIFLFPLFYLIT
ncbi:MAG TPA: cytochrome c oxidase subunit 3 family protein [Spirochaetia bacterium]|nr:cytochrome c oxidase subunit 3 family protein [Spirochaetia bacterium]